jgi:hypothetical protein
MENEREHKQDMANSNQGLQTWQWWPDARQTLGLVVKRLAKHGESGPMIVMQALGQALEAGVKSGDEVAAFHNAATGWSEIDHEYSLIDLQAQLKSTEDRALRFRTVSRPFGSPVARPPFMIQGFVRRWKPASVHQPRFRAVGSRSACTTET